MGIHMEIYEEMVSCFFGMAVPDLFYLFCLCITGDLDESTNLFIDGSPIDHGHQGQAVQAQGGELHSSGCRIRMGVRGIWEEEGKWCC